MEYSLRAKVLFKQLAYDKQHKVFERVNMRIAFANNRVIAMKEKQILLKEAIKIWTLTNSSDFLLIVFSFIHHSFNLCFKQVEQFRNLRQST